MLTQSSPKPPSVRVVLADDHAIVREGIAALCAAHGLEIAGQCSDGASALRMITALAPDFGIVDLHMPVLTGIEVIRKLRAEGSTVKLIVLSISREAAHVREALEAGADGYLLKDGPGRHLLDAISYILDGGVYISPLLRGAAQLGKKDPETSKEHPLAALSPREQEVFHHLVNGLRPKDIAELLDISPKTVDTYRAGLMRKLQVRDLVGLVKFAIEHNLTSTSGPLR